MVDRMFCQVIRKIFYNAIRANCDIKSALYEAENIFKRSVTDIYFDTQKLAELSNSIFDKEIYPMLKAGKIIQNNKSIDLSYIKKVIPETNGILKEINLCLEHGEKIQEFGGIRAEDDDLLRFKITLFVNAICYIILSGEFTKVDDLSETEFKKFKLGFIRTLIHELNHLRNYFTKSKEWLLNDFRQFYSFLNLNRKLLFPSSFIISFKRMVLR